MKKSRIQESESRSQKKRKSVDAVHSLIILAPGFWILLFIPASEFWILLL
jgi:hypothetical protein